MKKRFVIIGSGIGGLASACLLSRMGHEVTVLEKNDYLGGRIGLIEEAGYKFDKGPSWYLMPDVFEHFFTLLGKKVSDYLNLVPLHPSYRIFFEGKESVDLDATPKAVEDMFESWESGSGKKFQKYLKEAEKSYRIAKDLYLYRNYDSALDLFDKRLLKDAPSPRLLLPMSKYVESEFQDERIQKILQYQLVFLGGSPYNTPALYSMMSHVDFNLGVSYPMGGMYEIAKAMVSIGSEFGVKFKTSSPVKNINVVDGVAKSVVLEGGAVVDADAVISNADMYFTENVLLDSAYRERSESYWQKRVMAPSAFIMYLGVGKKIEQLAHHSLIFSKDWKTNFSQIFDKPVFPDNPSLYICAPSKTDDTVAPKGKENLFILAPIASGLEYTEDFATEYGNRLIRWIEKETGAKLQDSIEYRKDYSVKDFSRDYNSFKGTALGLAHTLGQSVFMRPNNISKKVNNLYYVGAGTNPGIGMPTCLISAEICVKRVLRDKSSGPLQTLPS